MSTMAASPGVLLEPVADIKFGQVGIANLRLKRLDVDELSRELADKVLQRQGIDRAGLDRIDRLILSIVDTQYGGGPVGIEALAATLNEDRATLEEVYEPYLVHMGFLARGPRGRLLTGKGKAHLSETT